jgi:hypothetical protein
MDDRGLIPSRGNDEILFYATASDRLWSPPSFLFYGYWGDLTLGIKRLEREGDNHLHLVPSL